jgi:hypothetical protein
MSRGGFLLRQCMAGKARLRPAPLVDIHPTN